MRIGNNHDSQRELQAMDKWRYKISGAVNVRPTDEDATRLQAWLDDEGQQGWELAAMTQHIDNTIGAITYTGFWKRRIAEDANV